MKKIVLTGGPCAGKTTVLNFLGEYLTKQGYNVIIISETASEIIKCNISPKGDYNYVMNFQDLVMKRQKEKETNLEEFVQSSSVYDQENTIVIYDRGLMDNRAYLPSTKDLNFLLKNNNITELEWVSKYDLVIDLASVSVGNTEFYENDDVRKEKPEEAREIDRKTAEAWLLHDDLNIIMPTATIEEKVQTVIAIINNYLKGRSLQRTIAYEVDLEKSDLSLYTEDNSKFVVVSTYLLTDRQNNRIKITRKSHNGNSIYTVTYYDCYQNSYEKKINYLEVLQIIEKNILLKTFVNNEIRFLDDNYHVCRLVSSENTTFLITDESETRLPSNISIIKDYSRKRQ